MSHAKTQLLETSIACQASACSQLCAITQSDHSLVSVQQDFLEMAEAARILMNANSAHLTAALLILMLFASTLSVHTNANVNLDTVVL
jgi:hypothetical protein